ncbi:tyrosine-type recombinase/integrase [Paenibacillus sp. FSL R10-2788]|uniref:tyrosine-type recombinase/integrase n=1 Tax=Paenibacillus sp. FSL R10-2788 TaxID=2954694 RepID=UPI0030FB790E
MPVYKDESKKKNKYWYEFEAGKDPLTNKRNTIRKKGFLTEDDALKAMTKAMNDYFEGNYIEPSKTRFIDYLLNTWFPAKRLGDETKKMYLSHINNHIKPSVCGQQELGKLNSTHIQQSITQFREKGLEESSVKKIYNIINTSLNDALIKLRIIKENPALYIIDKPKVTKKEIVVWDADQARKFIHESVDKSRYSFCFKLALATGMRQGELLGLRWKDVDIPNSIIRVTQTLSHDGKTLTSGAKTVSSIRAIAIDVDTKVSLIKLFNLIQIEKKEIENEGKQYTDNDLVICTNNGSPCSPRNLMRTYYSLLDKISVPKITFHNLRHTHATLLLLAGIHPKIVSERLGHSSVKITLDTYSHLLPTMQEDAAKSIGNIFGGHFGGQETLKQDKLVKIV